MFRIESDFEVLSRSLAYYGVKESALKEKWLKRLKSLRGVKFFELSEIIDEFLTDLETPAEIFYVARMR